MALRQISQEDFSFWRRKLDRMRDCHEKEFLQEMDADLLRAMYRGKRKADGDVSLFQGQARKRESLATLTRMFSSTNTILPNLYNQNPKKLAVPQKGTGPSSAALMTAGLNHYMKVNHQKIENQDAIMNGWFFGLGWKKIGYQIATESNVEGPESKLSPMDRAALGIKSILGIEPTPTQAGSSQEVIRYEGLSNTSESPLNVLLDDQTDLHHRKVTAHRLDRTLHDLMEFGEYESSILEEIEQKFRHKNGTRFDVREIDLILNELIIEQRNGLWILVFLDNFPKPLRYERMNHEGSNPWSPLMFTNEPGVRYPISHMKVASRTQEWIDNIVNLQLDQIGKQRSQTYINEKILNPGQLNALKANKIGGLILGNRPASPGDIAEVTSKQVGSDQFNILNLFQQSAIEILGATPQRVAGRSKNKTLGQDELAEGGAQLRDSGMLDRIRDWMIDQSRKEGQQLKQFSNATLHLQISPKDFVDRETGKRIEETWVEFMTERHPLPLRMYLEGDYDYDVNVYEAVKPNNPSLRQELMLLMNTFALPEVQNSLLQNQARVRLDLLAKKVGETLEHIDSSDFLEELDPRQVAALQAMQVLQQNQGAVPESLGGSNVEVEQQPAEQPA